MAAKKQTASKGATQKPKVPSIDARIDRLVNREDSSIKAIASVNIGGAFAIHGIRVIDSQKGLFVVSIILSQEPLVTDSMELLDGQREQR